MKEHFVIVGGQRCGTSYLYSMLDDHPEICMAKPMLPEPKYFLTPESLNRSKEEYHKTLFSHCAKRMTKAYGEKSTSYYEREESAERIAEVLPRAKIIFLLRNPVSRAISNYFFSRNNGLENRTIEDVFLNDKPAPILIDHRISVDPFNYLGRGFYHYYVKNYLNHFPKQNIKILISEEIFGDAGKIQDLYDFLQVKSTHRPSGFKQKVNSSLNTGAKISPQVLKKLSEYYQYPNKELAENLELDLSIWHQNPNSLL